MSIAVRLLLILAVLAGVAWGGSHIGRALQAQDDAPIIKRLHDDVAARDAAITRQKLDAAGLMQQLQAAVIAKQQADAALHQLQETYREADRQRTADARRRLADDRLRITVPIEAGGCGGGGAGAVPGTADAAGAPRTETVDLPGPVARDLRQLVLDADELADDYRACYRFVHPDWHDPLTASRNSGEAESPDTQVAPTLPPPPTTNQESRP